MINHVVEIFLHFNWGYLCFKREVVQPNMEISTHLIFKCSQGLYALKCPQAAAAHTIWLFYIFVGLVSWAFRGRKNKFKPGSGLKIRFLDPNPTKKRLSRPQNTFPKLPCPAPKKRFISACRWRGKSNKWQYVKIVNVKVYSNTECLCLVAICWCCLIAGHSSIF